MIRGQILKFKTLALSSVQSYESEKLAKLRRCTSRVHFEHTVWNNTVWKNTVWFKGSHPATSLVMMATSLVMVVTSLVIVGTSLMMVGTSLVMVGTSLVMVATSLVMLEKSVRKQSVTYLPVGRPTSDMGRC